MRVVKRVIVMMERSVLKMGVMMGTGLVVRRGV